MKQTVRKSGDIGDRLSVPGPGRTINKTVSPWSEAIAEVFSMLLTLVSDTRYRSVLIERQRATFNPILPLPSFGDLSYELESRLAVSALLCEWFVARLANPSCKNLTLDEAESWFLGDTASHIPGLVLSNTNWLPSNCLSPLRKIRISSEFLDLLPYILEVFDLLDVDGRIISRSSRRARQRTKGTVYTPSDVSDFIVQRTLSHRLPSQVPSEIPTCIDPACGTGLFLRSALYILEKHSEDTPFWELLPYLYGMDISHQAVQSCAFVLLACCLKESPHLPIAPWRVWQYIRGNLVVVDSTLVTTNQCTRNNAEILSIRTQLRQDLLSPEIPIHSWFKHTSTLSIAQPKMSLIESIHLDDIFPEVTNRFDAIFGNPPYSRLSHDDYQGIRAATYETAPVKGKMGLLYPLFVEMMWRFAHPRKSSGGMIIPMSIAYSTSSQIKRLRAAIQEIHGDWRFAFFDRTPDSLFGDDVKTRNAIILWHRDIKSKNTRFWTGPLLRWNSRNRKQLFSNISHADLGTFSITKLIPKLGTHLELETYHRLRKSEVLIASMVAEVEMSHLTPGLEDPRLILINSTGYNWIPTFRIVPASQNKDAEVDIPPSIRAYTCGSEEDADFVFACLNSRLTYWLWRVESDCFHVTREFIRNLPFHTSIVSSSDLEKLRELSKNLWIEMQCYPVKSVNAGRTRTSYYPYACMSILDSIDAILARSLTIPTEFLIFLSRFVTENIVAGRQQEMQTNPALRRIKITEDA